MSSEILAQEELSLFERLSQERKELQEKGLLPSWFTTQGWQMFKDKFLYEAEGYTDTAERISKQAASHTPNPNYWQPKFYELIVKGWMYLSTPVLANTGTDRGCSVSCSGSYIGDSVYEFYDTQKEAAVLSQQGFGTSGYLGDIRPRGTPIKGGGKASGVWPVIKDFIQVSKDISQGGTRRGAWAGYLPIEHGDFWEVIENLKNNPDDFNLGWNISDEFIARLDAGDEDAETRFQEAMYVKAVTGKGYFFFTDKTDRQQPEMYYDQGLRCKASNLCTEITLHSDENETFTCVLSGMNLKYYDEFKDTNAVFTATVFLDCIAQDFIEKGKNIKGLEKAVRFTERHRALGLGVCGYHTYLQQNMIAFESFEAHMKNTEIFSYIEEESLRASKWMAVEWGEPEVCKGYGVRNTHRTAVAPTMTSALIAGGVSQGIEPVYANAYTQPSTAGELIRINPVLLDLMKERGVYNQDTLEDILKYNGSVQQVTWLSDREKLVFKTFFEIDQMRILQKADVRQRYIDQAQSLNFAFAADEDEEYIAEVIQAAFKSEFIKSVYYMRSQAGIKASKGECIACE